MRACGRRRCVLAVAACAVLALVPLVPQHSHVNLEFPKMSPHELAHALADFSNHPKLDPQIESWSVEEEASNYTWWRYTVSYSCGARCTGRAELWHAAGEEGAAGGRPRHGPADVHRLRLRDTRCTRLPLLPWPWFCDATEVETWISGGAGGGARLRESARGRACGAADALAGRCGLRARREHFLRALRRTL